MPTALSALGSTHVVLYEASPPVEAVPRLDPIQWYAHIRYTFITSSPRGLMTFTAMRPNFGFANGRDWVAIQCESYGDRHTPGKGEIDREGRMMDQAIHNKIVSFIRGIEANLGSRSHLTPDTRTLFSRRQKK